MYQGIQAGLLAPTGYPLPTGLDDFWPTLSWTVVVAIAAGLVASRAATSTRPRTVLWFTTALVPVAFTWTPAALRGTPGCHWGLLPWEVASSTGAQEVFYNILLFVPAGTAAWLLPVGAPRLAALCVGLLIPPAIEAVQLTLPMLNRACQAGDILNNMLGVLIGWCLVAGAVAAVQTAREASPPTQRQYGHPQRGSTR